MIMALGDCKREKVQYQVVEEYEVQLIPFTKDIRSSYMDTIITRSSDLG